MKVIWKNIKEKIAIYTTKAVGSMECAIIFFGWSLLPVLCPSLTSIVSYVSQSIIQLVLLSVIMVGQEINSRDSEKRAQQDHVAILAQFDEIKQMHNESREMHLESQKQNQLLQEMFVELHQILKEMHEKSANEKITVSQPHFEFKNEHAQRIVDKIAELMKKTKPKT